ncbi:MAG: hypothetical protein ACOCUT_01890 [bacterium]
MKPVYSHSKFKIIGIGDFVCQTIETLSTTGLKDTDIYLCHYKPQTLEDSKAFKSIKMEEELENFKNHSLNSEGFSESLFPTKSGMVFLIADLKDEWNRKATSIIAQLAKERDQLTIAILPIYLTQEESFPLWDNSSRNFIDAIFLFDNEKLKKERINRKVDFTEYTLNIISTFEVITNSSADIAFDTEDLKVLLTDASRTQLQKGKATGKDRAIKAFNEAYKKSMNDCTRALLFFQSGINEITMDEIFDVTDILQNHLPETASITWGAGLDHTLKDEVIVSLILN